MKIGFSTSVIQRGKTGVAQYVFALLRAMLIHADQHEFNLFVLEEDLPLKMLRSFLIIALHTFGLIMEFGGWLLPTGAATSGRMMSAEGAASISGFSGLLFRLFRRHGLRLRPLDDVGNSLRRLGTLGNPILGP